MTYFDGIGLTEAEHAKIAKAARRCLPLIPGKEHLTTIEDAETAAAVLALQELENEIMGSFASSLEHE